MRYLQLLGVSTLISVRSQWFRGQVTFFRKLLMIHHWVDGDMTVNCMRIRWWNLKHLHFANKSPACPKGRYGMPPKYLTEQFPTLLKTLGAHHGCGPFRGPVCATRRYHLGTDGSKGLYRNQAENNQQTETFVLIHAWRCSVE